MLDPLLEVLFRQDVWGTRCLLETCRELSPAQFQRSIGIGLGSLERTCTHLVGSLLFFSGRFRHQAVLDRRETDGKVYTPEMLLALLEQAEAELYQALEAALASHALTDLLNWSDLDDEEVAPEDQVSYAVAIAQMIDHGIHHRTQAVDMLDLLGYPHSLSLHPFRWEEATRGQG